MNINMFVKKELIIFKNLSDETRLGIVEFLLEGEKCVCEIFPKVKRTQSTVSIHLSILEEAGIVSSRREGKKVKYRIKDERVCRILRAAGNKKARRMEIGSCRKKYDGLVK
ncbi:MAG: metalloregulator ArsR/SmtB family transcription factor [Candidatus Micrarchaeota archaeon]